MFGLRRIKIGTNTVASGEGHGREESAKQNIAFFDFGCVEEDGEGDGVEDSYDVRVRGNERTRRHVGFEDCGFVFVDSVLEELVLALKVEVI